MFRGVANSANGEVSGDTIFRYEQYGNVLRGSYGGGAIVQGDLLGTVNDDGTLDFLYHHLNADGQLMAGRCHSVPRFEESGRLVLDESWEWMTGDKSAGESVVAEVTLAELGSNVPETIVGATIASLASQYSAALSTLNEAIEFFPEPAWSESHPDGSAERVVFHALFYTDVYLGDGLDALKTQPFHESNPEFFQDYEELESREPVNQYDRAACLAYLEFCRGKVERVLAKSTESALVSDSGFQGRDLSRLALHIYNIRHIQHHAAQLGLRNQLAGGKPLAWKSR